MGNYIQIGEVRTWYEERGDGEPLVLFHGGLTPNETWGGQLPAFAERFRVIAPERRGHGRTPDVEGPLTYDDMATDTIGFLEARVNGPAHLVGWSDGGIIGLLIAIARPDLLRKLVVIGTNFNMSGAVAEMKQAAEAMTPDSPEIAMFRELYEAASPDGPEHWPVMFLKYMEMAMTGKDIPLEELSRIEAPTLVLAGDDDMITLEHTIALFRAIPNSELAVVPGTSHTVLMEKPELINRLILDFLEKEPVPTLSPIRRAPASSRPDRARR
jgi:pimeloyl-ACP methyl ester carboxylesterase